MRLPTLLLALLLTTAAPAQFQIQDPHTTADLRGIHSLGNGVAWASGSSGTILRTEDAGFVWQLCSVPPGADHLDFRAIQAFDNNTAIVMSSGKGDLSRLYKTTDGCQTWKLFTNPDKEGFWDALQLSPLSGLFSGWLVGDPVNGEFPLWFIVSEYQSPANAKDSAKAQKGEAAFAASNTAIFVYNELYWLGTGGTGGAHILHKVIHGGDGIGWVTHQSIDVPIGQHTESSGVFSLSFALEDRPSRSPRRGIAVGGDYLEPDDSDRTAAYTIDSGQHWRAPTTPPHGYRSSVAYDPTTKTWITVGPNGTDISTDDGRNWQPLRPSASEAPDSDQHWNALSLPFVVGPHGRIGHLRPDALKPTP